MAFRVPLYVMLFAMDAMAWLADAWRAAGRGLAAVFAVRWDPLGASRASLPLHGCRHRRFTVAAAGSERERRVAAWLYRWHPVPDEPDWRRALERFGLEGVPPHVLSYLGEGVEEFVRVYEIRLAEKPSGRGHRTIGALDTEVSGPTPLLGGLTPERFIADLDARRLNPPK